MPGKIYIESKPVAASFGYYNHSYLVYEDAMGREFVIRGGPGNNDLRDFGQIITEAGIPMTQSKDFRAKSDAPSRGQREIDLSGRDASEVWEQMKNTAQTIPTQDYSYEAIGPKDSRIGAEITDSTTTRNSNSTVAFILQSEGIDPQTNLPTNATKDDLPGIDKPLPPFGNDGFYTLPTSDSGTQTSVTIEPMAYQEEQAIDGGNSGGFLDSIGGGLDSVFSSIGSGLSSAASGIGDFFGGLGDRIGGALGMGRSGGGSSGGGGLGGMLGFQRIGLDPGGLERLLSQGIDKFTDRIAERLTKSDGVLGSALGRTLTQNNGMFGDLLKKAKMGDLSGGLENLFSANNIGNVFGNFVGNAIGAGFNKLLGVGRVRTSTSSQESDRSREARSNWNLSRGQQAALFAQMVQQGQRNS